MDSYQTMCAYCSGVEAYLSVHKVLGSILSSKNGGGGERREGGIRELQQLSPSLDPTTILLTDSRSPGCGRSVSLRLSAA